MFEIVMPTDIAPDPLEGSHVRAVERELRRCRFQIGWLLLLPHFPWEWPAVLAEELRETVRRIDSLLRPSVAPQRGLWRATKAGAVLNREGEGR